MARKMKKRTFAIPAAAPAMKPKPNAPATTATIAEIMAHFSMGVTDRRGCATFRLRPQWAAISGRRQSVETGEEDCPGE